MAQQPVPEPSFSGRELYAALRLVVSDVQARSVVEGLVGRLDEHGDVRVWELVLDEDTLLLLSLVSDDVYRRVLLYRKGMRATPDPEADRTWVMRREALKRALRQQALERPPEK